MTLREFKDSLQNSSAPDVSKALRAMWAVGKDDWDGAHRIAQDIHDADGSWVHAYLHRKEGDLGNASYWYSRAEQKMPDCSLKEEWEQIVAAFLQTEP